MCHTRLSELTVAMLSPFVLSIAAFGQTECDMTAMLVPADGRPNDYFGYAVASDGEFAIVGATADDEAFVNQGSAYVFRKEGAAWVQAAKLVASDGAANDQFGVVAIRGDVAAVGARFDSYDGLLWAGSVYVFRFDGTQWIEEQRLVPNDAVALYQFGQRIRILGDTIVVGHHAPAAGGSVYVFHFDGESWSQAQKLTAPLGGTNVFGDGLDLAEGTLVVSDPYSGGRVHWFEFDGAEWTLAQTLESSQFDDSFTKDVATNGQLLVVRGAVQSHVFERQGKQWIAAGTLPTHDDVAVAPLWISADLIAGSVGYTVRYFQPGYDGWLEGRVVDLEKFGAGARAMSNHDLFIGHHSSAGGGPPSGFVTAVDLTSPDCNANLLDDACETASGAEVDLNANTVPDGCECVLPLKLLTSQNENAYYGFSATGWDSYFAVGAPGDVVDGMTYAGSVFLYRWHGTEPTFLQRLVSPDPANYQVFGYSLDMHGDTLAIGAPGFFSGSPPGRVYIFQHDGEWSLTQDLEPDDGQWSDDFGLSVSLDGDVLAVGAPDAPSAGFHPGAVYVFRNHEGAWQQEQKLVAPDPVGNAKLGISVHAQGDLIVAGASGIEAAYVFRYYGDQWIYEQKILPPEGMATYKFGQAVAIAGSDLIVGSPVSGDAFVFKHDESSWFFSQQLTPADDPAGASFGSAFAAKGDWLLIGAPQASSENGFNGGAAYVFHREGAGWVEHRKLTVPDAVAQAYFGGGLHMASSNAVIGASGVDGQIAHSGVSYIFPDVPPQDCNKNGAQDFCDFLLGVSLDFDSNGVPDECDPALGDITGDGAIDVGDLLALLMAWGPCLDCPADLTADGVIDINDLLIIIMNWS